MKHNYDILTTETNKLFGEDFFEGFKNADEINFEKRFLDNVKWIKRCEAEEDQTHQQPIAYCIVLNPKDKKIFAYQRAKRDQKSEEVRLNNKWSWGVGGHVERYDENSENPIYTSMLRELNEEVDIQGSIKPKVIGYVNNNNTPIDKVHVGIIYLIETDANFVLPKADEIAQGRYHSLEEIENILNSNEHDVEEWSKIAFEPLKKYLKNF